MSYVIGGLILGVLLLIAILQFAGKPISITITHVQKFPSQGAIVPPNPDQEHEDPLTELVSEVQSIMTGGEKDGK